MLLADIQLADGRVAAAVAHLIALVRLRPEDAAAHRRLGGAYLSLNDTRRAVEAFRHAVALEPGNARGQNNLGQALLQIGEVAEAMPYFERALTLSPEYVIANYNVAVSQERLGLFPRALQSYERLLALQPGNIAAWVSRGTLLAKLNSAEAALESFDKALSLGALDARTLLHKASVLLMLARAAEAIAVADQALERQADLIEALNVKAGALCRLHRPEEALHCLARALDLNPEYVEGWCSQAIVHHQLTDPQAAAQCYRRALLLDPDCIEARTGLIAGLIPAVPLSAGESAEARRALDAELAALEDWLQSRDINEKDTWTLARQQFFYLSYQEESNKTLLQRYRRTSAARLAHRTGLSHREASAPIVARASRRLRLGIVSAHVFDHSVFNAILQGWLDHLARDKFDKTVFSVGTTQDAMTLTAAGAVDHFEAGTRTLEEWAEVIHRSRLDVLIYPEVGMDRTTLALANLRLAERQFAGWGHPETTGLPTIDYYLSGEAFEPVHAQEHYSERLVRLPNFGVYYRPYAVASTPVNFSELGIPGDRPTFVCPGTPFKYRPEDDGVLVDIARRVGRCTLVFFKHDRAEYSSKLRRRLSAAFEAAGLDPAEHLLWIPWLPRPAFLGFLQQADVYLDTIGFSGFNTMMQAVQANLPGVAHAGRFMRGRLGSGILTRLGLTELVARQSTEYVDIAVKLAQDVDYNARMRKTLSAVETCAYEDAGAVGALSNVLLG